MDSGEWDSALELMKNIPRSSPFAPVKLFCKAVSAFYNNDNSAVLKAAAMIPPDSMFSRIAESFKYNFTKNNLNQNHDISKLQQNINILRYLWSGPFDIYQ
ncbi:hypothetical protein MCHI_002080, partial [Candidatus Magnetoovum chiemensis]